MSLNVTVARQMIWAELLRLRKKRGVMALALAVALGPLVIWTGYGVIEHASNPAQYGPVGGLQHFAKMLTLLGVFVGPVAAVFIGAEAGAGDLGAGVFRDDVLTGRSRLALFLTRIPAALAVTFAVIGLAFVFGLAVTFGLAGGLPTPSLSLVLESAAWLALANGLVCVIAIGVASLSGSRPGTITALIGWELVISPMLVQSTGLGSVRRGLLDGTLLFLKPGPVAGAPIVAMPVAIAVIVLLAWLLVLPALGAWRMQTRDA